MSIGTDIVKIILGVKNAKGDRHYKNYLRFLKTAKLNLPYDSAILLMDI